MRDTVKRQMYLHLLKMRTLDFNNGYVLTDGRVGPPIPSAYGRVVSQGPIRVRHPARSGFIRDTDKPFVIFCKKKRNKMHSSIVLAPLIVLLSLTDVHGFNSPRVFLPQSFAACRVPLSTVALRMSQEDHTEDKYVSTNP